MTDRRGHASRAPRASLASRDRRGFAAAALVVLCAAAAAGCRSSSAPPRIEPGTACAGCGMTIVDLRFACERPVERRWRAYDSIECLIRQGTEGAYLADYDSKRLHAADSHVAVGASGKGIRRPIVRIKRDHLVVQGRPRLAYQARQ